MLVMDLKQFHDACLALPGASFDIKWGSDRVYSVGGKMFAVAGPEGDPDLRYAFKCSDIAFEMLIEQGKAKAAPYLARAKWVQLVSTGALPDEDLKAYLAEANHIVAGKLTQAERTAVGV